MLKNAIKIAIVVIILMPSWASAANRYVWESAGTEYYGTVSFGGAITSSGGNELDNAVAASAHDDVVYVGAGDYLLSEIINGKYNLAILGPDCPDWVGSATYDGTATITHIATYILYCDSGGNTSDGIKVCGFTLPNGNKELMMPSANLIDNWEMSYNTFNYSNTAGDDPALRVANFTIAGFKIHHNTANLGGTSTFIVEQSATLSSGFEIYSNIVNIQSGASATPIQLFGDNHTVRANIFKGVSSSFHALTHNGRGSAVQNSIEVFDNLFMDYEVSGQTRTLASDINIVNGSQAAISNNTAVNLRNNFVTVATAAPNQATATISNTIGVGSGSLGLCYETEGGVGTITNSLIVPIHGVTEEDGSGVTAINSILPSENDIATPQFVGGAKEHAYICVGVDDVEQGADYTLQIVEMWKAHGVKGTVYVNPGSSGPTGVDMNALWPVSWPLLISSTYTDNIEWGNHFWSHEPMGSLTTAFDIAGNGITGAKTITETGFAIDSSDNACDCSFDTSTSSYDSIKEISDVLDDDQKSGGGNCWVISNNNVIGNARLQSSSLANDTGAIADGVASSIALDISAPDYRFYRDEVLDTKTWMLANLPVSSVRDAAYPGGSTNQNFITWLIAQEANTGFLGCRVVDADPGINASNVPYDPRNYAVYESQTMTLTNVRGANNVDVITYKDSLAGWTNIAGNMYHSGVYVGAEPVNLWFDDVAGVKVAEDAADENLEWFWDAANSRVECYLDTGDPDTIYDFVIAGFYSEAAVKAKAAAYAVHNLYYGKINILYSHIHYQLATSCPEASSQELGWILDGFKSVSGIRIRSFGEVLDIVRNSGDWTSQDSGERFTLDYNPSALDFHILAGGPGIDAGTATGLGANFLDFDGIAMTDGAGAALDAGVDIGCYNFAGHGANGPGQLGPGLMIENISPLELLGFRYAALGAYEFQGH